MLKNQYIEEKQRVDHATRIGFYQNAIPFTTCIPQYKKALAIFNQFIQENPDALSMNTIRSHRNSTMEKAKKLGTSYYNLNHYILEMEKEKWGINIYCEDGVLGLEMDEYIQEDSTLFFLRTMFSFPEKEQLDLLDCSFAVVSEENKAIYFNVSRPRVLPDIKEQSTDNQPLLSDLKNYMKK